MTKFLAIKEIKAIESVDTVDKLICRLLQAKRLLKKEYANKFIINRKTVNFKSKNVVSTDKQYLLQWKLREYPTMPESYENQQTTGGQVYLYKLN